MAIKRLYDTLVGATVNVNQLVDADTSSVTIQSGHKYYAKISGTESIGASTGTAISVTGGTDMVIDLTAMLGSTIADYLYNLETATAGAGIAKLREWGFLTDEYIPYNVGSLESVEATAHKMVGFNQWDEETESGSYNVTTGNPTADATKIRTKNDISVLPNTTYYKKTSSSFWNIYLDADKNLISYGDASQGTFTTPNNCYYIRFNLESAYGTTYNHDICINLSSDRNGEYEPYSAHTYDLGTDTLRGLFKLDSNNNLYADGDTKTSDGTVTRKYGVVDLGTLDYVYNSNDTYFYATISNLKDNGGWWKVSNVICEKYVTTFPNNITSVDKAVCAWNSGNRLIIKDSAYTDAATFKTAMSGVMLVYELATPTTETSTPFQNPQICDPDGTEEYVTSNGVPVGHETRYQL